MKTSLLKFGEMLRFVVPQMCQYLLHLHSHRCQGMQMVEHYQLLDGCVRYLYPEAGLESKRTRSCKTVVVNIISKVSVTAAITSPTSFVVVEN